MTNAIASTTPPAARSANEPALAGPPGLVMDLAVAAAVVLALDTNSRDSLGGLLLTAPIWLLLAAVWLGRFGRFLWRSRGRVRASHWARWLAVPLVMGLVFWVTRTDAVKEARFELSRGALEEMASDVLSGGALDRGWVGLYDVGTIERTANGFLFVIDDSGLSRHGFAYSTGGEPIESEDSYSGLWTGATFEHLDGGWWTFWQGWD